MTGLSLRQAREAMSLGWPEALLRDVSALLRARELGAGRVSAWALEVGHPAASSWPAGRRVAFRPHHTVEVLVRQLDTEEREPLTIYTDGSGTFRRDQPAAAGVVIYRGEEVVTEAGVFVGNGTSNHAELSAIRVALELVCDLDRELVVRADSQYAIGVLTRPDYQLRANVELIERLRAELSWRRLVRFEHVPGHSGIPGNERADQLAGAARRAAVARAALEARDAERESGAAG